MGWIIGAAVVVIVLLALAYLAALGKGMSR